MVRGPDLSPLSTSLAESYIYLIVDAMSTHILDVTEYVDSGQAVVDLQLWHAGDGEAEAEVHTDFLRIVLEVINAVLAGNLSANPELVYALLHRNEVFVPLHENPRCTELLDNIFAITNFFNAKASRAS